MQLTRTLPTNKFGKIYYGPKTLAAAQLEIKRGADLATVLDMLDENGYKRVAALLRKYYS